jgi:hypothetical protein
MEEGREAMEEWEGLRMVECVVERRGATGQTIGWEGKGGGKMKKGEWNGQEDRVWYGKNREEEREGRRMEWAEEAGGQALEWKEERGRNQRGRRRMKERGRGRRKWPGMERRGSNEEDEGRWEEQESRTWYWRKREEWEGWRKMGGAGGHAPLCRKREDKERWEGQEDRPWYVGRGRMKEDGRGRRTGPGM